MDKNMRKQSKVFAWTIGGEKGTTKSAIGGLIIIIAIIFSQTSEIKK
jgi:hypothetical protein